VLYTSPRGNKCSKGTCDPSWSHLVPNKWKVQRCASPKQHIRLLDFKPKWISSAVSIFKNLKSIYIVGTTDSRKYTAESKLFKSCRCELLTNQRETSRESIEGCRIKLVIFCLKSNSPDIHLNLTTDSEYPCRRCSFWLAGSHISILELKVVSISHGRDQLTNCRGEK
jgi:hypothetical protein